MVNQKILRDDLPKGFIEILKEECKGCGVCMDACPHNAIELSSDMNRRGHRYAHQMTAEAGRLTSPLGANIERRHRQTLFWDLFPFRGTGQVGEVRSGSVQTRSEQVQEPHFARHLP